jgi:hypothetical protein
VNNIKKSRVCCVFKNLPYNPFRETVYTVDELMHGYTPGNPAGSLDARIALHFVKEDKKHPNVHEALAQRIHDHGIDSALYCFVNPKGSPPRKIVGALGSHTSSRDSDDCYKISGTRSSTADLDANAGGNK